MDCPLSQLCNSPLLHGHIVPAVAQGPHSVLELADMATILLFWFKPPPLKQTLFWLSLSIRFSKEIWTG